MKKLTIALIFGGRSQEHEVSLVSAKKTFEALGKMQKLNIVLIGITRNGEWYTGENIFEAFENGITNLLHPVVLSDNPSRTLFINGSAKKIFIDVAFPLIHGPYGEDGTLQGLLELADIPYIGCGVFASACAMDKLMTKAIFKANGILQVPYIGIEETEWVKNRKNLVHNIKHMIGFPCFVKPSSSGSSIGVNKVKTRDALEKAVQEAFCYDAYVIVEKAVQNAREVECSVIGNEKPKASIPGEIDYEGDFYDFHAKYIAKYWNIHIPPRLPKKIIAKIRELAVKGFRAIRGSGMARVDFLIDSKTHAIYLNEINTIPSFRPTGVYARLWKKTGFPYREMIETLIKLAMEQHAKKSRKIFSFQSGSNWFKKI